MKKNTILSNVSIYSKIFIRLVIVSIIRSFGRLLASNSKGSIKCVSLNNQPCHSRTALVDTNFNETLFHQFIVTVNKFGVSCNIIDDPYSPVCVRNKVKNMNVKVSDSMSGVKRFLVHYGWFQCKCRLNESECNSKQKWNHDEHQCERKELDDVES